jgi:hypothetical protein
VQEGPEKSRVREGGDNEGEKGRKGMRKEKERSARTKFAFAIANGWS